MHTVILLAKPPTQTTKQFWYECLYSEQLICKIMKPKISYWHALDQLCGAEIERLVENGLLATLGRFEIGGHFC